jgi:hypothetical protein
MLCLGASKVQVTRAMKHLQEITESGQQIAVDEPVTHLDYSAEKAPIEWSAEGALNEKYSFVSELARYVIIAQSYCKTKFFVNLKFLSCVMICHYCTRLLQTKNFLLI